MCNAINPSLMTYYHLLEKDYAEIQQNEPTGSRLGKEFARVARKQAETDDKITALLTRWKKDKQSGTDSHFSNMVADPLITQKADKIRLAMKIAATVGVILAIATLTTAIVAACIYGSAVLSHLIASIFVAILFPIGGGPSAFIVPSVVINLLIASGSCVGVGMLTYIVYRILGRSSAIREDRIQSDRDFHEFVNHYLEKKLGFFPNRAQLADQKLHSIYSQWKYCMQNLPADATCLHNNRQLRNALEHIQLEMAT